MSWDLRRRWPRRAGVSSASSSAAPFRRRWRRTGLQAPGIRTRVSWSSRRSPPSSRKSRCAGCWACWGCRRSAVPASSPARRRRTSPAWRRLDTHCSRGGDGMWRHGACLERRRSRSSSASRSMSVLKALTLLGLGRERVISAPVDGQGRIRSDAMPRLDADTIVCLQAGDVNTGAFDPAAEIIPRAKAAGAWVHVDGAFGLWAAAAPARAHLMDGFADADSWATDAHKWLNVPYDSGIVFVRDPRQLRDAMAVHAPYLVIGEAREPEHYTPDFSRRARGVEVWAALRSLGRQGLADLIERTCRHAARFAA